MITKKPYFTYSITSEEETDLVLVSVTDSRTGFVVRTALPKQDRRTASIVAFTGARYSRSDKGAEEILKEIKASGKDANTKLATIFRNYGHASVADMANLFGFIEKVPQSIALKIFNVSSVGSGQEVSTRYVDFSAQTRDTFEQHIKNTNLLLTSDQLNNISYQWEKLQDISSQKYQKYCTLLTNVYTSYYDIDTNDKKQKSALSARVFDSARAFLPFGMNNKTSLAYVTSAREWARIISVFKSDQSYQLQFLAEALEALFAPNEEYAQSIGYVAEAPDLIRYTSGDETVQNSLNQLDTFLKNDTSINIHLESRESSSESQESHIFPPVVKTGCSLISDELNMGEKVLYQSIKVLYPSVSHKRLVEYITTLTHQKKLDLSHILFSGFTHHVHTPSYYSTREYMFCLSCSIAENRDLNRHRAWGRFNPIVESQNFKEILSLGYTLPQYISDNPQLKTLKQEFETDLQEYYTEINTLLKFTEDIPGFPHYLLIQTLPFAHIAPLFLHGSAKEISYITKLRVRPGGHINYRTLAYQMAQLVSHSDALLHTIAIQQKPNPLSREEFLDRS